jgi:hypothetical protein
MVEDIWYKSSVESQQFSLCVKNARGEFDCSLKPLLENLFAPSVCSEGEYNVIRTCFDSGKQVVDIVGKKRFLTAIVCEIKFDLEVWRQVLVRNVLIDGRRVIKLKDT